MKQVNACREYVRYGLSHCTTRRPRHVVHLGGTARRITQANCISYQTLFHGQRSAECGALEAKTFSLPQRAAQALIWTDNPLERYAQDDAFAKKYEQMHRFVMFRRIGGNETNAIDALHGIIAAENQFNAETGEYAQHLNCSQGQHDGLFAPENGNDIGKNPVGRYIAEASYKRSNRKPFHGYYFLLLTAQGPHAHGGGRSYIVDGKMTGGFAVVAFPAVYRSSGVKTFIVNQHGMIHEKDLGPKTTEIASSMKAYDPDSSWPGPRPDQFGTMSSPAAPSQ